MVLSLWNQIIFVGAKLQRNPNMQARDGVVSARGVLERIAGQTGAGVPPSLLEDGIL
jgi:hypothetical protein